MTPFYLITGFLGSGKTTFLKQLLNKQFAEGPIAVIQNEFAPNGIDGYDLKTEYPSINVVEINNGSVFCACLLGNFISTLEQVVQKFHPKTIFLEASGLSDPTTLSQVMSKQNLSSKIYVGGSICLVDALHFQKSLQTLPQVLHQIRMADLIVVNKTDLINENNYNELKKSINKINSFAVQNFTSFGQINQLVWESITDNDKKYRQFYLQTKQHGRPDIQTAILKTSKKIPSEKIEAFLKILSTQSIRSKGFLLSNKLDIVHFNTVFDRCVYKKYEGYMGNTEVVAIGNNINNQMLNNLYIQFIENN